MVLTEEITREHRVLPGSVTFDAFDSYCAHCALQHVEHFARMSPGQEAANWLCGHDSSDR